MYHPSLEEFIEKAKEGNLIPVYKEILADMETPVSAFRKTDMGDYAYLLESVERGEKLGRYSFLASSPSIIFKSKGSQVEIIERGKSQVRTASDPLEVLKGLMAQHRPVSDPKLPRFIGGAVGYLGYDMARCFEPRLQASRRLDDLNLPDAVLLLTDTLLVFDHLKHKVKVISNAYIRGAPEIAYREAVRKVEGLIGQLRKPAPLEVPSKKEVPLRPLTGLASRASNYPKGEVFSIKIESNLTEEDFKKNVQRAKEYIRAGDVIQVVLSQRFHTEIHVPPFDIYRALRTVNPSPYMYYLKCGDLRLIGSSPEILVRAEDGMVGVRPIAGTRPRGMTPREDEALARELLADPKERAEHIMLVDLGKNDLGRVAEFGTVKVNELMVIERYSHVMHIVSDITGGLTEGKDAFDVLRACFPAGTVTGAPKIRAMEIIQELEPIGRGPYAGAVGYFSFSGNLDTCITIRTIVVKGSHAYVQAGAGIVADSVPAKEYQETLNKAQALVKAIELAETGLE
jgi:anthranilate synthase component 1